MATHEVTPYIGLDRVLELCADARGLRDVKPGFATSKRYDTLFALGWPNVRVLVEDPSSDEELEKELHTIEKKHYPAFRLQWSKRLAQRLLRQWMTPQKATLPESVQRARKEDAPLDEEEARILAPKIARFGPPGVFDEVEDGVLLFEALLGPSLAASLLVEFLETTPDAIWGAAVSLRYANAQALGYVLLRTPSDLNEQLTSRLEALWEKHRAARPASALTKGLDVILHGSAGAERSGDRLGVTKALNPRFCTLVRDDPGFVAKVVEADLASKPDPDGEGRYHAALAFAGGPAIVEAYARAWTRHRDREAQAYFVETLGEIRADQVVEAIRAMASSGKAKNEALAWLAARARAS